MNHRSGVSAVALLAAVALMVVAAVLGAVALLPAAHANDPNANLSGPSGLLPDTITTTSGDYAGASCSSVTTCNVAFTMTPFSTTIVFVGGVTLTTPSAVALGGASVHASGIITTKSASSNEVWAYGFVNSGSTSVASHAYANFSSATVYNLAVDNFAGTVTNLTFWNVYGVSTGSASSASVSCSPTVTNTMVVSAFYVSSSETTMTQGQGSQLTKTSTTSIVVSMESQDYLDPSTGLFSASNTFATSGAYIGLCVADTPSVAPMEPNSLAAGVITTTTVPLTWTDPATQAGWLTGAKVYYAPYAGGSCGSYNGGSAVSSPYTSYTQTGLTQDSFYCFGVTLTNTSGTSLMEVLSNIETLGVPNAPTGLSAVPEGGTTSQVSVSWTLSVGGNPASLLNQTLERFNGATVCSGGSPSPVYTNIGSPATTTHVISGLTAGTNYAFQIADWNSQGMSPWSACATTSTFPVPSAPTGLTTTGATASSVSLAWSNPSGSGTIVNDTIDVNVGACGATTTWVSTNGASSAFTVMGLTGYTTYCFKVQAWNGGAESTFASAPSLSVSTLAIPPPAATVFVVSAIGATTASFTWTNPSVVYGSLINATLYSGTSCGAVSGGGKGTWTTSYNLNSAPTSGSITGLTADTSYCFGLTLWDQGGQGITAYTNGTTGDPIPSAPTGLTYVSASHTEVTMSWTNPAGIIVNVTVAYGTVAGCGSGRTFLSVGTTTTITVSSLSAATSYYWEVSAWSTGGESTWTSCTTGATQSAVPPAPYNLAAQTVTATSVWVLWANPSGYSLTDNIVYVSAANGVCGTWSQTNDIGVVSTAYQITGLTASSTYCIEVTAVDAQSPYSLPLFVTTSGGSPNGLGGLGGLIGSNPWPWVGAGLVIVFVALVCVAVWPAKKHRGRK